MAFPNHHQPPSTQTPVTWNTIHLHQAHQNHTRILQSESFEIKHWDIQWQSLHERVQRHQVSISYLPTEDPLANLLTKSLPTATFADLSLRHCFTSLIHFR